MVPIGMADGCAQATHNAGPANLDSATGLGPALSSIMRLDLQVTLASTLMESKGHVHPRSSMVSWRTRRIGRIRHFAGASPAECIPPTGGAAAMNRNRLANGSEIEAAEAGRATRPLH
jgi:hypothetical protein